MSATLKFVRPEDQAILREYLEDEGTVLIMNEALKTRAIELGYRDGDQLDGYDFGGEADRAVEMASSEQHLAFEFMRNDPAE